jgi:two-component system cell cycle response regulator
VALRPGCPTRSMSPVNKDKLPDWEDDDEETRVASSGGMPRARVERPGHAYLIILSGSCVGQVHDLKDGAVIGRTIDSDIVIPDDHISRRHAQVHLGQDRVIINDLQSRNGTFLNGNQIEEAELKDGDRVHLGGTTVLKFTFGDGLEETFSRQMYDAAMRDALTGLYNRRHFEDRFRVEFAYAARHASALSVLVIDLDLFKKVNDTHGHVAGDKVLREIGARLRTAVRSEDTVARYGGEEFVVLARGTPLPQARELGERLRNLVAQAPVRHGGKDIPITISVGVATVAGHRNPQDLFTEADKALYAAKAAGRNRVVLHTELPA